MDTTLLVTVLIATLGNAGLMWWRIGKVETKLTKMCPFGNCPIFERAKGEAAPTRREE